MRYWLLLALVLVGLAGCRGDDKPSPDEQAVRQATENLLDAVQQGQYDTVWETLHPAHQAIVSREQLVSCGARFGPAFEAFDIDDVSTRDVTADELGPTQVSEVTVLFELTPQFQSGGSTPIDRRFWFVQLDGTWRWLLGTGELAAFRQGNCGLPWPGGSASP